MSFGGLLPDEIVLTRDEAGQVLFALDAAIELTPEDSQAGQRIRAAAQLIIEKFLPDLPDL